MDYEYYYKIYEGFFTSNKSERDDLWYASCYCGRLMATFINSIFKIHDHKSESEKLMEIKAMNDAYQNTFPPDEA